MQHNHPPILDIAHAAQTKTTLQGHDLLSNYARLLSESIGLDGDIAVQWTARFEFRDAPGGEPSAWLHLTVDTHLMQTCQRCLQPADVAVHVDRVFRFVASEAVAEQDDEDCDEDLLVSSRSFDLAALIEDEVLLELPLVPRHDVCPVPVKTVVADADFDEPAVKPNPFAALAVLKGK